MASSGIAEFDRTLGGGFPIPSAVLVEGQLGSAKEKLLYSFVAKSDLPDRTVVVTKAGVNDVIKDAQANGVELSADVTWLSGIEGEVRVEFENLASLSFSLKEILKKNTGARIRIAFDVLSSLLMRNTSESVYRFLDQMIAEVKRYDAVLLATIEPGMHPEPVLASIEHLFDGVLSVGVGQGLAQSIMVKRMRGVAIAAGTTVLLSPAEVTQEAPQAETRRLAAIMFTNIVGYTVITQRDEERAMEILEQHNSLLRPVFKKHQGREVKTIGDSFLLEFGSALEALQCAIEVQETLSNHNKAVTSDEDKLKLRIGIHLGDVILRDNDVFGDAVNIASKIQELADPGGICVSDQVHGQVMNKTPYEMMKAEQVALKNISHPVDVYHVLLPWEPTPKVKIKDSESEKIPISRRLAILPLANLTRDPQDDYFVEGMMEELIIGLSNVKDLRVIARSSVMKYKETKLSASEIARELNVGSVVEGSVRKLGSRMKVTIQMIDGRTEEHLFANTYDKEIEDVFAVQTEIAKAVSRKLRAKIRSIERERIEKKPTQSVDAYSVYLKGRYVLHKRHKESMEEAVEYFKHAVSIDEKYAKAYAGLADAYLLLGSYGYLSGKEAFAMAKDYVSKALDLDNELAEAHVSLGFLLESFYYDFPAARKEFERGISLSPSYAQARHWYALDLALFGDLQLAASQMEKALEIDPLSSQIATILGSFYALLGRNSEALFQWNKALTSSPDNVPVYLNRGVFYAEEGRREEALADLNKAMELASGAVVVKCILSASYAALGDRDEALRVLHEVEEVAKKEYVPPWYFALIHAALGDKDEFFSWASKSIEDKSVELASLANPDKLFDSVKSDPRFDDLLKKAGLPLTVSA